MDLEKYPVVHLSDEDFLNRLTEECSELIQAIAKRKRFGKESRHPRTGEAADVHIANEIDDVSELIKEANRRLSADGTFDPVEKDDDYWGGYHS